MDNEKEMSDRSSKVHQMDANTTHPHDIRNAFLNTNSKAKELAQTSLRKVINGVDTSMNVVVSLAVKPDKVADIILQAEGDALEKLKELVETEKTSPQHNHQMWNFASVPLESFDKTLDDVFLAFLRWAKVENTNRFNVSRAFERLTAYATWMENTGRDMVDPPLSAASIRDTWNEWNMKVSYDKAGHFIWWLDLAKLDLEKIKSTPEKVNLRLFVWFSHFAMFDPQAQQNGCVLVHNFGNIQFWNGLSLLNPTLARKISGLTIGTMPVKMKQIYVCESPQWAQLLVKLMMPFLSAVVRDRIIFLVNPKVLEDILGVDCIPVDFVGTQGRLEKDIVWAVVPMA